MSNIVNQYFKKEIDGCKILLKLDPIHLTATQITVAKNGEAERQEVELNEQGIEALKANGFEPSGALQFNLYDTGLA